MILVHGTSEAAAREIVRVGLRPRGRRKGNWTAHPSRADLVYLSETYAPYFAACAAEDANLALVEVDPAQLDERKMLPDEDFLEQATRNNAPPGDLATRTQHYRRRLRSFQYAWRISVEGLGNCAHRGAIAREALKQVIVFPGGAAWISAFSDPSISLLNHRIMGGWYRALTQYLLGYDVDPYSVDPWCGIDSEWTQRRREALCEGRASGVRIL